MMGKTVTLTMAQALLRFLDQQYLSIDGREDKLFAGILGIFGHGNVTGLGHALEFGDHALRFIRGNNEQGMVHVATAFAKQHDRSKIMAVTSSIGPGATNLVTGAATATINRLPVLLLPGDIFAGRGPDPVLQQLENPHSHEISVNDCLKPVSRYFDRINRPEQLMEALIKAMKVLTDPALMGAVTLCLPQDVQCESFAYPAHFLAKRVHKVLALRAPLESIEEAATLLAKSERPLIIAGGGVNYGRAQDALGRLARQSLIPVAETQSSKGSILAYDALENVGGIGVMGSRVANRLAKEADCIVAIGTRLSDFISSSKTGFPKGRIININIDPFDALKLDPVLAITADAHSALTDLLTELTVRKYQIDEAYQKIIRSEQEAWSHERKIVLKGRGKHENGLLDQCEVIGCLNDALPKDAIIVAAAGSLPGDLQRLWQSKSPKSYHLEYGFSCMGYEVAGAVGVKMAAPDRSVWALVGDGSFLMMHSEAVMALQEDLKINIVVFDSGGFNSIKSLQMAYGSHGYGTDLRYLDREAQRLSGKTIPIDFAKYGEGLGLSTFRARSINELITCIGLAQKSDNSSLIEVKIKIGTQSGSYDSFWQVASC